MHHEPNSTPPIDADAVDQALTGLLDGASGEPALEPPNDIRDARLVQAVLDGVAAPVRRSYGPYLALAAAVALMVVGGTWATVELTVDTAEEMVATSPTPTAVIGWIGEVAVNGEPLSVARSIERGARITTDAGRVRLRPIASTAVELDLHTQVQVAEATGDELRLRLERGGVRAVVRPEARSKVRISTAYGEVVVTGTAFAVRAEDGRLEVDVFQGHVRVEPLGASALTISAGQRYTSGEGVGSLPPEASSAADPLWHALAAADNPGIPAPALAPPVDVIEAPADVTAAPKATGSAPAAGTLSAPMLLQRARTKRQARDWATAAQSYRQLIGEHGSSPIAIAALISLGQLELRHLRKPVEALSRFDRYLARAPKGSLAEEARVGRIAALRAMRRAAEEAEALEDFLVHHPRSLRAQRMRARLQNLRR